MAMKCTLLASALSIAMISGASGIEVWQGHLFITTATSACGSDGWGVNDFFLAIFRPRGLENNGPDTKLLLLGSRYAHRYVVAGGRLSGAGNYSASRFNSAASYFAWNGKFSQASVKPTSPGTSTQTVVISVKISNFAEVKGCTVTLKGSLGNRPNL